MEFITLGEITGCVRGRRRVRVQTDKNCFTVTELRTRRASEISGSTILRQYIGNIHYLQESW